MLSIDAGQQFCLFFPDIVDDKQILLFSVGRLFINKYEYLALTTEH